MGAWWPPRSSKPLRPDYSGWVGSIPTRSRLIIPEAYSLSYGRNFGKELNFIDRY